MYRQLNPFFAQLGLRIEDVRAEGDCVVEAVLPAFAAWLGRNASVAEVRKMLVTVWRQAPAMADEVARELCVERAARGWTEAEATVDALLSRWSRASEYLPPGLAADATHFVTGAPVQVYMVGRASADEQPSLLRDIPGDSSKQPCRLLFVQAKHHVCRLVPRAE